MNRPVFLLALTLLSLFLLSVLLLPNFSNFENKISSYHVQNSLKDTESPNVVTSIVWDYRGYDTLGEETILFTATLGIYALFRKYREKIKNKINFSKRFLA